MPSFLELNGDLKMNTCYIFGALDCTVNNFSPTENDLIIAADGGYTTLKKLNVKPDLVSDYSVNPYTKTHINADDRSRLYGKWFVIEFAFNTKENSDYGNIIEFENIKLNVSQQTQQI